jgi:hypothetical protein
MGLSVDRLYYMVTTNIMVAYRFSVNRTWGKLRHGGIHPCQRVRSGPV